MRERIWLWIKRLWRRPGVRISGFGIAAFLVAIVAPFADRSLPPELVDRFSRDAVLPILNILASSMLAVTTFSLGIMVQAFQTAAGKTTPRVYRLLMQDMTTLNALSVFVGTFLFSLASIVMFRAGVYRDSAAVIVFALTVMCILLIVVAILRWIAHLSQLGSLHHTLTVVEDTARAPLEWAARAPNLGARNASEWPEAPQDATPLFAPVSGYVQYLSLAELNDMLKEAGSTLWIDAPPGRWVLKGTPLAYVSGECDIEALMDNFTIGDERTMEQDARFGLVVLSEVASRALSPGINDPGTAIDVIHRVERLLWRMGQLVASRQEAPEVEFDRIILGSIAAGDLVQDGFTSLMHDGGGRFDVMAQVLKSANRLSKSDWPELARAADEMREAALGIAERQIDDPEMIEKLHNRAEKS